MDDDLALPDYVTKRGDIYHYVRRIPEDLQVAFGRERVQRSLRTSDKKQVRALSTKINDEIEKQFAEARAKLGFAVQFVDVSSWTSIEWDSVAAWFEARLMQDDLERRLPRLRGGGVLPEPPVAPEHWTDRSLFRQWMDLNRELTQQTTAEYALNRLERVNAVTRRIGVAMLPTSPACLLYAARCQAAELRALDVFFRRDRGESVEMVHPDSIAGPWRPKPVVAPEPQSLSVSATALPAAPQAGLAGKTLTQCQAQYKLDRIRAKKSTREAHLREMSNAIALFEKTQKIKDIGLITRKSVVAFRSYLQTTGEFQIATVNKKTSFITTLLATAEHHAWIDNAVKGNLHLDVPEGEDDKDPFSQQDLAQIFSHPTFARRQFFDRVKSGNELQFWLPVISCTHGMISSEIIQLGADTIVPYPETDILCFSVTSAGSRHIKSLARKRFVPIRKGLILDGVLRLAEEAKSRGSATLWTAVDEKAGDTDAVAAGFSSFWSDFLRNTLEIKDPRKSLYSLRHSFKDALRRRSVPLHVQNMLMGHAEAGTGKRYGTKREPPPVPIEELDQIIQSLNWRFLDGLLLP